MGVLLVRMCTNSASIREGGEWKRGRGGGGEFGWFGEVREEAKGMIIMRMDKGRGMRRLVPVGVTDSHKVSIWRLP